MIHISSTRFKTLFLKVKRNKQLLCVKCRIKFEFRDEDYNNWYAPPAEPEELGWYASLDKYECKKDMGLKLTEDEEWKALDLAWKNTPWVQRYLKAVEANSK